MGNTGRCLILVTVVILAASEFCSAQQYYQPLGPTAAQNVSPYLNQLRGKSTAVNYLFGVAPFTQQPRLDARSLYQDPTALRRFNLEGPDDALPVLPETGHAVRFLTYGPYFNLGNTQQRSNLLYPYQQPRKYK